MDFGLLMCVHPHALCSNIKSFKATAMDFKGTQDMPKKLHKLSRVCREISNVNMSVCPSFSGQSPSECSTYPTEADDDDAMKNSMEVSCSEEKSVKEVSKQRQQSVKDVKHSHEKQILERLQRRSAALATNLLEKRQEVDDLYKMLFERKEVREKLRQRMVKMLKKVEESKELYTSYDLFLRQQAACETAQKVQKTTEMCSEKDCTIKRLKEDYAKLVERCLELQHQVQRDHVYQEILEGVHKTNTKKFMDLKDVMSHFKRLIDYKEKLDRRVRDKQNQFNQSKDLLTKKQTQDPEREEEKLNAHCNQIKETQHTERPSIERAILHLYDMVKDKDKTLEGMDVNDMETQLDMIKTFIQDYNKILERHQGHDNA